MGKRNYFQGVFRVFPMNLDGKVVSLFWKREGSGGDF